VNARGCGHRTGARRVELKGAEGDSSPALPLHHTLPLPLHHTVPVPLPTLFWISITLVVVAQLLILRSTVRAMRGSPSASARRTIEWAYAVVPVIVLAVVLVATWQASREHVTRLEMEARANQTSAS